MRFKEKVIIVTGGAQGIGKAIATGFAKEGAIVVIADIQGDLAEIVAAEIKSQGGQALAIKMDVTNYKEVNAGVNQVLEMFGKIDILINNAGWDMPGDFMEQTEEYWDKILNLNLKGPIIVSHIVLKSMIKQNRGKIINISSRAGRGGTPYQVVYSGAKGGVITLTRSLARAYAKYNIAVNCVAPGATETPALESAIVKNPGLRESLLQSRLFHRFAKPDEIAAAVLFLASDDAEYITGQTLSVDGGADMY